MTKDSNTCHSLRVIPVTNAKMIELSLFFPGFQNCLYTTFYYFGKEV